MRKKSLMTLLSTAILVAGTGTSLPMTSAVAAPTKAAASKAHKNNLYIVELAEAPVVAYDGGIKGLQATRPRKGSKIDPNSPQVVNYKAFLEARQAAVLAGVGGGKKVYSYGYVFNGFAAELNEQQVARLKQTKGVVAVTKDVARSVNTSSTPAFLGLTPETDNVWGKTKGEGVIIGIVDGGIWPESLSFSDRTGLNGNATKDGKLAYQQIPGWHGRCVPGEEFNASHCNQKLIGAQYFNAGWGGNAGIDALLPWEFNSPRDYGGHGTHTASTAGGNQNVPTTGPGSVFGSVSGIAPRARIAAYKVCWQTPDGGSCFSTDSVAAIDQAVADGVDVINFSISGSRTNFRDPVEIAFLFAADAGVFVAASAGNSGPTTSTVAHPGPWLTTVAAGTHNRNGLGETTLGNGTSYSGASFATALAATPLVDSANAVASGATATDGELCAPGALDPAVVMGKIVLCKRGTYALVDKSAAVAQAGGVGMLLYNDPAGATNTLALFHSVPTVHVVAASGQAIKTYIANAGASATASISQFIVVYDAAAPLTATFSSRGPLLAGGGDLLKPDLIAPGQDILAAVAPPGNGGRSFDLYSGTSMSSPHVAGLAALLKEEYPRWSPMAIKSALMTTGTDVLDGGTPAPNTNPVLIFRQGAGHVKPASALNPGLVYDSGWNDWLAFICATQPQGLEATCNALWGLGYSRDASDLNVPSIAIGAMAGSQTVTRKVTNVSGAPLTVNSSVNMPGFAVTVSPSSLTLAKGATGTFTVTFQRTTAALNNYAGGQLYWTGGGYSVRIPMVVRPVALAAPAEVSGSYDVTFGYNGTFSATARGLVPAVESSSTVGQDPDQTFDPNDSIGTVAIQVNVPAGSTYARFQTLDLDVNPGTDLDLYVFLDGTQVGASAGGTSAEVVNLANPTAGTYTVFIHGWGVPGGSSPFVLNSWVLGSDDVGNMTVSAPTTATTAATGTVNLSFSGLEPGVKYLGSVVYGGTTGMPAPTIVRVDAP